MTTTTLWLLALLVCGTGAAPRQLDTTCTPLTCAVILCLRPDCPPPSVLVTGGDPCGCCRVCAQQVGEGASCDRTVTTDSKVCMPGLICHPTSRTCVASS